MRLLLSAAVLALLYGAATCDEGPEASCPLATDISCNAYSTLEIRVTGGSCEGTASANCEAVGTSQSKYVEAYKEWFGGDSGETASLCDSGNAEAAAEAVAEAVAEVWTSAQAQVSCKGYGSACGYSITGGTAFALAMSEALAQAAADAGVGDVADAFCFADVRAVSTALAQAAASATASACVKDTGTLEDWQEAYVRQVAQAISTAFARASAGVCADTPGEVKAESKCSGKAKSATEEEKEQYTDGAGSPGDACGGTRQLKACVGGGATKCCDPGFGRRLCYCKDCEGPWIKKSVKGDSRKIFEDKEKKMCFCENTADEGESEEEESPPPSSPAYSPEASPEASPEVSPETSPPTSPPTSPAYSPSPDPCHCACPSPSPAPPPEEETYSPSPSPSPSPPVETYSPSPSPTPTPTPAPSPSTTVEPCEGAVNTTCSAYSTLNIKVTYGTCEGEASANCDSYSSATNSFKEAFEEWWKDEESVCDKGTAEASAEAIATAIAQVWTEATTKVTCEGQGYACGWSAGSGSAWAAAFAEAVAQAAADASDPAGQAEAFCFADVRATSAAIAVAAADAQSEACTTGGTVEDYEESMASTVTKAIATAFASATAETCNAGEEVKAASKCKGKATSDVEKDEYKYGAACAGASQAKACTGPVLKGCCAKSYRRRFCRCPKTDKQCGGQTWIRSTDYGKDGTKRSFKLQNSAETCFCDDSVQVQ